ncbi:GIY-YIG nuclease family protein [Roseomonas sp. E05]|uniref:GIY-YIG nuclease family protein n=1 Tax=Roseomonas sp. E05 TaxID=3046310 RepID=UPI0024B9C088|nr:GIY-YIG nuclease family protein [Roseomonas sp. E05]MDJ0390270.1 GIY-YIG nuclease family protein [Roseomonas sp. E05]
MTAAIGRSLELYYIDGRPDGMLTAELFNWTGHVLMAPRTQIAAALKRPEASYAGIYLLIGEQAGEPRAYVGEGEDISARIKAHDTAKDWWTSAVLVTAAANKLNKAHVRYLEARLIAEARTIGRMPLDNATSPPLPSLSEADVAKMEAFLENLLIVLPAVRVDMFIQRARPAIGGGATLTTSPRPAQAPAAAPVRFTLETPKHGLKATAVLIDGEFVVEAGSLARDSWVGQNGQSASYAPLHAELVNAGILAPQGAVRVFTENYAFKSPSAAAAVINGRNTSGPAAWRLEGEGITYKEWEAKQLAAPAT